MLTDLGSRNGTMVGGAFITERVLRHLDEVRVGDAIFKQKSAQVFEDRLSRSGAIVVTHSMNQIRRLCKAAAVLEEGRLEYFPNVEDGIARHLANMKVAAQIDDALDEET